MTATNQDFTTYAGDNAVPIFTVYDGDGNTIDISTVSDIVWNAQRDLQTAPVLSKTLTGGGIALIADGVNGQFQVTITGADTAVLSSYYIHQAKLVDGTSDHNISTVTLGRMQVGRAPIWTYSGDPSLSARDKVRFYLQDTNPKAPILLDPEIDALLLDYPNPASCAATAALMIAQKFSGRADKAVGDLRISYSQVAKQYMDMVGFYQNLAATSGLTAVYSGGTSRSDMETVNQNTDRNRPPFAIGQNDMYPPPAEGSIYNSGNDGGASTPGNSGD